jgi:hypothetical protein
MWGDGFLLTPAWQSMGAFNFHRPCNGRPVRDFDRGKRGTQVSGYVTTGAGRRDGIAEHLPASAARPLRGLIPTLGLELAKDRQQFVMAYFRNRTNAD